jgi:hypothetical protein
MEKRQSTRAMQQRIQPKRDVTDIATALRIAVDNDGTLDKESTSYNDLFDAFRLALKFYHFEESSGEY